MPYGYHELEHILEHLPSDIEQYLLNNKIRRLAMSKNYFRLPISTASSGIHIEPFYSWLNLTPFNIEENLHNKINVEFAEISIIDEFSNYLDNPEEFDFTNKDWVGDLTSEQDDWYYEAIHTLEESAFMLNGVWLPRIYDEEVA